MQAFHLEEKMDLHFSFLWASTLQNHKTEDLSEFLKVVSLHLKG